MSYDNLSSVSQNVLKFYHQLTGEESRIPFIFDDFHSCRSKLSYDIGFVYRQTDGPRETSIPPYNFVVGGIKKLSRDN
jgi:hypothetical protein